jgi:hypothetical protein
MIFRCVLRFSHTYLQQSTISTFWNTSINLFTMEEQKKKSEVSPATTLPWPYSHCSDDNADEEKEKMTTPAHTQNVPKEITACKFNTTGKNNTLANDDDVSDIDLVGIAHQIESQERAFAYEQEFQLVKEVELATQEACAAAEAEHVVAEEREL